MFIGDIAGDKRLKDYMILILHEIQWILNLELTTKRRKRSAALIRKFKLNEFNGLNEWSYD